MLGTFKALQQPRKQEPVNSLRCRSRDHWQHGGRFRASGSTDRNCNAMGSQQIPQATTGGATHDNSKATTGMTRTSPSQHDPNGSPSAPPTAKQGPQGDPFKANDAPTCKLDNNPASAFPSAGAAALCD